MARSRSTGVTPICSGCCGSSAPCHAETVSIDHIKRHYYGSQHKVNPTGIVPLGPELDFGAHHDRDRFVS